MAGLRTSTPPNATDGFWLNAIGDPIAGATSLEVDIAEIVGRGDRIRTCDPHTPSVMRYQAALRPDRRSLAGAMPRSGPSGRLYGGGRGDASTGGPAELRVGPAGDSARRFRRAARPARILLLACILSMLISPAYAQSTAATPAASGGGLAGVLSLAPLFLVFAVFWLLMIRPQQKRQRELARAVDSVKKGDQVVTAGGIVGRVTRVEDRHVEVEIAANTRVRVVKATLAEIVGTGAAKPAND